MSILCSLNLHNWNEKKEVYNLVDPGVVAGMDELELIIRRCERCGKSQLQLPQSSWIDWRFKEEQTLMLHEL